MGDKPQANGDGDTAESAEPRGGARLAAARIDHEISARDIAKELHLDEPTVLAIEENNFELLGAPVFVKGHLRKYAELVGVPVEDVIADYYQMTRSEALPPVVGRVKSVERTISPGPWIAGAIGLLAAGAVALWWFNRPAAPVGETPDVTTLAPFAEQNEQSVDATAAADGLPDEAVADVVETPAVDTRDDSSDDSPERDGAPDIAADANDTAAPPLPDDAAAASQAPAAIAEAPDVTGGLPQIAVELTFSGDCWTEVVDADGERLFYDLGTAGRVVTLSGAEPLQLVLGDSSSVSMKVDGRNFPVPPPARRGGLTRLTVNRQ